EIQSLIPADLELIPALQPAGWPDIMPHIEFYVNNSFCFPIKIVIDNKIAGIGTNIIHQHTAWLAHIIVHPDYRNKGIGTLITQTLIDSLQAKGLSTFYLMASDMGEPIYKKLGFKIESEYLLYKDVKPLANYPASPNIIPISDSHKEQIAALDSKASGEDRMFHLEKYLATGYVYVHNDMVEGFYLPGWGEGLIMAGTALAGIELMKQRFTEKGNASFPSENKGAAVFMDQHKIAVFKTAKRMRLGPKKEWQPQYLFNRIGGNLG
ncbi:MAG: N-acetyltransferase, partial [Sphingobacteriaceae bacterium]